MTSEDEERKARHARKNKEASQAISAELQADRCSFLTRLGASTEQIQRGSASSDGYHSVMQELESSSAVDFQQELQRVRQQANSPAVPAAPRSNYDLPPI